MVAVSRLQRKVLRDLRASRAQFAAVTLIIVFGVAAFVGSYQSYQNLYVSYEGTYQRLRMADYWISMDYVAERAAREMDDIPGVAAEGRIVGDVAIELEMETGEKVAGRVISLPAPSHPRINDVQVEAGSYFSQGSGRQVLLEKRFAEYHGLGIGNWLTIKKDQRQVRLQIAGTVVSPEYIWVSKSAQEPFSSERTFGVLFVPQARAESLFDMNGLVNDISLALDEEADHSAVFRQVERILQRYHIKRISSKDEPLAISARKIDVIQGARSAYVIEREDQVSNNLLKQDLDGFKEMAVLFPTVFLSMAALAIYVLLSRLVESQRVQIGLMRALGYGKLRILLHYTAFALVVGVIGSVIGALVGRAIADWLTAIYAEELKIPFIIFEPHWNVVGIGLLIGIGVPLLAGMLPAWATTRLRPAEAMRPPTPPTTHRTMLQVLLPFLPLLPSMLKLPLRNVFRNMRRSLFMATGVASAMAMILISMALVDAMDWMMTTQFDRIQQYDARVIFQGTAGAATASYIEHLQGVQEAEAILEAPYRLKHGEQACDTSLMGLEEGSTMYTLLTPDGSPASVVPDSVLLTSFLSNKLAAAPGDTLHLEPMVGSVGDTEMRLAGLIDEPIGGRAYVPLKDAQELLRLPGAATGVLLRFEGPPAAGLLERIYKLPETASIELAGEVESFIAEFMDFFWVFIGVMLAISFALGMAIIFNGVMVNVLERRREIAIMRAVGMSNLRLSLVLSLENLAVGCLGVAMGIPGGYYLTSYFMQQFESDIMSMPMVIYPRSYVIAGLSAAIILFVSQIPAIRQVCRMRLPTVTKDWAE